MNAKNLLTLLAAALILAGVTQSSSAQVVGEGAHYHVADEHVADEAAEPSEDEWGTYYPDECCYGPSWVFGADAVYMQRSRPDSLVLMHDTGNPARNLNANSLGFDFQPGWAFSLVRENDDRSIEFRCLSVDDWDSTTRAISGAATTVRINNAVPFDVPGVTAVNASYSSELLSAEFNLRRQLTDCCTLLGGFRYVELDERFSANMDAGLAASTYTTFSRNRLYGGQLGSEAALWSRGRLTVNGIGKVGVYHNSGGQNTTLDSGIGTFTAADTSDRAAFMAELALTGVYSLNDRLSLRANYSLLWLETVTLASDQIPVTNFFTSNGIDADDGVFYHGLLVGLEYRR